MRKYNYYLYIKLCLLWTTFVFIYLICEVIPVNIQWIIRKEKRETSVFMALILYIHQCGKKLNEIHLVIVIWHVRKCIRCLVELI